ncbi:hypothetical protein LOC68_08685 [Blastopirellula sp. JC732]|uniref:Uncharacterized protein n=1 Tax=Blastopirellula sediminis TaxID=2894196 RepID=A0A9X1SIU8_9BACT|nr:hypothetical protein [Blastopirellula sediminis]MCC9608754.1 hypothetical protein [Blastopirellula sediminis]MCC9628469.1 hypothetical protein [Blastopirellula sediminis]
MVLSRRIALLLAFSFLALAVGSAEAGWPKFCRWVGEGWSDGYHAVGSHWSQATIKSSQYGVSTGEVYVPGQIDHLPRLWHLPFMPPPTEAIPTNDCPTCRQPAMREMPYDSVEPLLNQPPMLEPVPAVPATRGT